MMRIKLVQIVSITCNAVSQLLFSPGMGAGMQFWEALKKFDWVDIYSMRLRVQIRSVQL